MINADGTGLQQLTDDAPSRNIRPDWSPDGRKIAFTSRRDGNDEIYVMDADGSDRDNPLRLTVNVFADNAADWSLTVAGSSFRATATGTTRFTS